MSTKQPSTPYQSIAQHGVIGDRRTAALVAADGAVDWMCLPDYDSAPVFGSLLDAERGGYWRLGPHVPTTGAQSYLAHVPALLTTWATPTGSLELTDIMAWPQETRPAENQERRALLRHLKCTDGSVQSISAVVLRQDFRAVPSIRQSDTGIVFPFAKHSLGLWATFPPAAGAEDSTTTFQLEAGDEVWAVLSLDESPEYWSLTRARSAYDETVSYWRHWLNGLSYDGPRQENIKHSGLVIHLLGYAPCGSMVASPTSSLPERIGGTRNWDYRYAWIRDASLSIAGLALLGDTETATRYLDWVAGLSPSAEMPLQVAYHVDGRCDLDENDRRDIAGYRGSQPVRVGNRAYSQRQLGPLGYLADCTLIYLNQGGKLKSKHWRTIQRIANFTEAHWHEPDSGIWELTTRAHFTASKLMSWVVLDRALKIARLAGYDTDRKRWEQARNQIHNDIMRQGWSERRGAFVQRYGTEALDAAVLLIPVMGFLPADHPRVRTTLDRIVEELSVDGLVYRFNPLETPVEHPLPMGEFEASFLPCTFWLATAYAMAGRLDEADATLRRTESLVGEMRLFSEEADPRNNRLLGNYPLLFSHVEYIRAVLSLDEAHKSLSSNRRVGHPSCSST